MRKYSHSELKASMFRVGNHIIHEIITTFKDRRNPKIGTWGLGVSFISHQPTGVHHCVMDQMVLDLFSID